MKITNYFIKPGYLLVNKDATLVRGVVGNSVAVMLYDAVNCFGGINQFIFPKTKKKPDMTPQYGNVAITALIRLMIKYGADRRNLVAQIIGGACCFDVKDNSLGFKNIKIARKVLSKCKIPIVSEDIGGCMGRKLLFHSGTNETAVFKVDKLRKCDWFLPGMDLRFDVLDR